MEVTTVREFVRGFWEGFLDRRTDRLALWVAGIAFVASVLYYATR